MPPSAYDWTICALRQCGFMSNYRDHLFACTGCTKLVFICCFILIIDVRYCWFCCLVKTGVYFDKLDLCFLICVPLEMCLFVWILS